MALITESSGDLDITELTRRVSGCMATSRSVPLRSQSWNISVRYSTVAFLSYASAVTVTVHCISISSAKSPYFCHEIIPNVSPVNDTPSQINKTKSSPDACFFSSRFFCRALRATL